MPPGPTGNSARSPAEPLTFGQDPNDLTNAAGPPAERPAAHLSDERDWPSAPDGFVVAANLQYFSGKPWAATAQVALPQTRAVSGS